LHSKPTFSLLYSHLSIVWKRQFFSEERKEKSEKIIVQKETTTYLSINCRFFLEEPNGLDAIY